MNSFFQIQSLQLLIFCMHEPEFMANLDYVLFLFSVVTSSELIIFVLFYYIVTFNLLCSHTKSLLVPNAYVSIEPIDCILLSSFELKAILLIYSDKTLCL